MTSQNLKRKEGTTVKISGSLNVTVLKNGEFRGVIKRFWDKKVVGSKLLNVRIPDVIMDEVIYHCNELHGKALKEFTIEVAEGYLNCVSVKVDGLYTDRLEISVVEGTITRYFDVDVKDPSEEVSDEVIEPKKAKKTKKAE